MDDTMKHGHVIPGWLLLFGCVLCMQVSAEAQSTVQVQTDAGPVVGQSADGVSVFKAIPFAAPPVGELRWREPQPVTPWDKPRDCTQFSARCPQPEFPDRPWLGEAGAMSEDCLYLNVWTPAAHNKPLPVMVWIHGGGFTLGAGTLKFYDGTSFAKQGVVLVTINYRLGPFGFFGHPALTSESPHHVSGNYGLLDQIAALQWVQRNIAHFGGDPKCVTIFGESAGSVAVTCLMASPQAKGLFHRAIAESGTGASIRQHLADANGPVKSLQDTGKEIADKLGIDRDDDNVLTKLRQVSAEQLLNTTDPQVIMAKRGGIKFGPVIDGYVLPENPQQVFAEGKQNAVPLLIGSNGADGVLHGSAIPVRRVAGYRWLINRIFKDHADQILKLFPVNDNDDIEKAKIDLMTISAFAAPSRRFANLMQTVKTPAYLYHFTRVSPGARRAHVGAAHGAEIPYVFGNFGHSLNYDRDDQKLAKLMQQYWINFAATGNPNGPNLPNWPAYRSSSDMTMQLDVAAKAVEHLNKQACDVFDQVNAELFDDAQ